MMKRSGGTIWILTRKPANPGRPNMG
jgi:hypothetical protein